MASQSGGNHIVGVLMLVRPQSRSGSVLWAMFFTSFLMLAPFAASADPLDNEACQRLMTERQALTVLGIDKHVEKGAAWAKERLTVADLNLVKRYLDVFEQIKFRCEKIVALVEPEEKDDDDDDSAAAGASPPVPERKSAQPVKPSAMPAVSTQMTPAVSIQIKSNSAAPVKPSATPAVSTQIKSNSAASVDPSATPAVSTQIKSNSAANAPLGASNASVIQIEPGQVVIPAR